ncbi:MAG: hypothetical protein NC924_05625 [Candidatus Omnitrophica bacterium]|nr:hypothetical protein [Candidatus Omnitrophota bacterium]
MKKNRIMGRCAKRQRRCRACAVPDSYPRVLFDDTGLCNFCRDLQAERGRLFDFSRNEAVFRAKIQRARSDSGYDVLIGVSGGKDGAYVAFQLKHKFKLRVLAYTNDLGILTDVARENIAKAVKAIGVDHVFYRPDEALVKHVFRNAVLVYGHPCFACTALHFLVGTRMAMAYKIPFRVHGRSPYQIFKDFSGQHNDFVRLNIENNLLPYDPARNKSVLETTIDQLWGFFLNKIVSARQRPAFYREVLPRRLPTGSAVPEFFAYFLTESYEEVRNMDLLTRECGMVFPTAGQVLSHFDCVIHDAAVYLMQQAADVTALEQELRTMVRLNALSLDTAAQRLAGERCRLREPVEEINLLKTMWGLERTSTGSIIRRAKFLYGISKRLKTWASRWSFRNMVL